jgi:hypothetical protein
MEFAKTDDDVNQANCWQGLSDVGRLQQKSLQECRRFEETAARLATDEQQPAIEGRGCMSHRWR